MRHVKFELHRNDSSVLLIVYPFTSDEEMVEFKKNVDVLHREGIDGFCTDCERGDCDNCEPSDRSEAYD